MAGFPQLTNRGRDREPVGERLTRLATPFPIQTGEHPTNSQGTVRRIHMLDFHWPETAQRDHAVAVAELSAFLRNHLARAAPQEHFSGFALYGVYAYECATRNAIPLTTGVFAAKIAELFPDACQAAWPRPDGTWGWGITGVKLSRAASTRELIYALAPPTAFGPPQ